MPAARLFPGDVELGKRDDDHKPGSKTPLGIAWEHRRLPHGPHRRSLKRIGLGLLGLIAVYYFFKNMPTDLENPRTRPSYGHHVGGNAPVANSPSQYTPSNPAAGKAEEVRHDFNGPIKFYHLAATLHTVSKTGGGELINKNIVCSEQAHLLNDC